MKEFRLSTSAERVAGVCFSAVILAAFAALLYALRHQTGMLIFCGLGCLLIAVILIIYVRNVLRAVAIADGENKTLQVRGIKDYTLELQDAVMLQTVARKNGQATVRLLVFTDKDEQITATVPTMFTFRQGIWAEPMAREMAAALGIEFKQTVPDWAFDKEKYQEHVKEEAEREKQEAKERRQKRMERKIQKRRNRK